MKTKRNRFKIEEEINEQYGYLLAAEYAYKYALLSDLRTGSHSFESLDCQGSIKVTTKTIKELEAELKSL